MGRRDFPDDFKAEAVRLVVERRYSFAQACEAVGVSGGVKARIDGGKDETPCHRLFPQL